MKVKLTILLLLFVSSLSAQRTIFYVADTKADCYGVSNRPCLQVKEKPDEPYALFYSGIDGFTYEEGYNYKLEIMRVKRERPPADGSAYTYYLIKVLSKERSKTYVQKSIPIPDQVLLPLARISKNGKMEQVSGNSIPDIVFDKRTGRISGRAGCNRYFGRVIFDNGKLSISGVGSTQMACMDMQIESLYLKHLSAVNRYQFNSGLLQLYKDQELLLQFNIPEN
jgi:heat shock protein HslJ